jgi:hypothetical protein
MKHLLTILIAILLLPAAMRSQPAPTQQTQPLPPPEKPAQERLQNNDWNAVVDLPRDEEIAVKRFGGSTVRCSFAGATPDVLYCFQSSNLGGDYSLQIDRASIQTVRLNQDERNRKLILGSSMAAGGLWLGIAGARAHGAAWGALGGMVGIGLGAAVSAIPANAIAMIHLIPGKLVYRQRERPRTPTGSGYPVNDR